MPPYFPILNSSAFEYALLPQHIPGPSLPTLPYLWPPVDFFPIFPPKMPLGAQSVHAVEQDALPSLPAAPGFSTIWPRTTPIPPYDGVNDCGSHEGSTGVDFWATGDQHPSVVVHTIPPVGSTLCVSSKIFSPGSNAAGPIFTAIHKHPTWLGQDTTKGLWPRTQTAEFQTVGTNFFQHELSSGHEPQRCTPQGV